MDQQAGTILNEADIYGPRTGHTDLDLCSAGTDVNDDYSACALMTTPVAPEADPSRCQDGTRIVMIVIGVG
jgi:hypothetical protein